ncbi:Levanase [Pseudarthrobacter chlorophenolicus A6]|uniref:Levanase n=2 Tax=Pseudarthrobacter chlorophenolicus TaxID=85085 RepID=B8HC20_PSECP|nr:glycoside hydrolase family 32 protein [Pseudarthrobacter chlorophenolicus]ACL38730.1 Levanase [Pseudarthrobacter chlorophenolicus A6]SDQ42813.1 levanbiose-producing levanase [Pseudarthrobacter chlorophenolicus]
MPPELPRTVLTALASAVTRRPILWAAVALAAVVVLVLSLVLAGQARTGPEAEARRVLGGVAAAQEASKDRSGGYASLWLKGNDRTLFERGEDVPADGAEDIRSIECGAGWLAGARMAGQVYLRSSASDAVSEDAGGVRLPDCISAEARDALLADLGARKTWPAPDADALAAPAKDPGYRPAYHLTPDQRWMNDPQRPFFKDGLWHYYYLYNADYPEGNGTEWFHATSTDLVHWKNEGVAIGKFRNGLGDIETGSAVVDAEGTAGFGKGAVIAVLTQQDAGVQRQSLFYSTDNGYTFTSYDGNPVMDNPGAEHWRDPRIVWDDANSRWLMLLAEGHKIGFYTSPDLKKWTYVSAFEQDGMGILECPDFFQMDVDGDPAKRTWVLAAGSNGAEEGRTTGLAYWTGSFDGQAFTPGGGHQWLDDGADFYAAVTWDDPRLTDGQRKASRHAIGWMNNWAYARDLPTDGWFGAASVVRDIRLESDGGQPALVSAPTPALQSLEGEASEVPAGNLGGGKALPAPESGAFKVDIELEKPATGAGEARLLLQSGGKTYATVGYDFRAGRAFVARDGDAVATADTKVDAAYSQVRTGAGGSPGAASAAAAGSDTVHLAVYVDRSSVEVFADGGRQTLTSLVFPPAGAKEVRLAAAGGDVALRKGTVTPLASIR